MDASINVDRRFSGLERLYGLDAARLIRNSHVAVIGIGGVGSWAAEALARSGVGRITLLDMDHIAESNINRQIHATTMTIGQSKVLAMQERIFSINPLCNVEVVDDFVDSSNWPNLLPDGVDAVIDACDQVKAKIAMAYWAMENKLIFISVGAAGGKKFAHQVDIDDLAHTTHDPLLAKVRYSLRKAYAAPKNGKKMGIACVFSKEPVSLSDTTCTLRSDNSLNCHGYGSLVSVTATFGLCSAGWVVEKIFQQSRKMQKYRVII